MATNTDHSAVAPASTRTRGTSVGEPRERQRGEDEHHPAEALQPEEHACRRCRAIAGCRARAPGSRHGRAPRPAPSSSSTVMSESPPTRRPARRLIASPSHARQEIVGQEDGLLALALRLPAALLLFEHPGRQSGRRLRRFAHGPPPGTATLVIGELSHVDKNRWRGVGGRTAPTGGCNEVDAPDRSEPGAPRWHDVGCDRRRRWRRRLHRHRGDRGLDQGGRARRRSRRPPRIGDRPPREAHHRQPRIPVDERVREVERGRRHQRPRHRSGHDHVRPDRPRELRGGLPAGDPRRRSVHGREGERVPGWLGALLHRRQRHLHVLRRDRRPEDDRGVGREPRRAGRPGRDRARPTATQVARRTGSSRRAQGRHPLEQRAVDPGRRPPARALR